jgi:hypothetical protein
LDGRPAAVAGETEDMPTGSGVLAPVKAQGVDMARRITAGKVPVLGHNIHGCGAACACGVEVGRGVAAAAVAVCMTARGVVEGVAIAAAVEEVAGPSRSAAVVVGQTKASPRRDMRAAVPPAGMRCRKP